MFKQLYFAQLPARYEISVQTQNCIYHLVGDLPADHSYFVCIRAHVGGIAPGNEDPAADHRFGPGDGLRDGAGLAEAVSQVVGLKILFPNCVGENDKCSPWVTGGILALTAVAVIVSTAKNLRRDFQWFWKIAIEALRFALGDRLYWGQER